jgi:hypothetical protein
MPRVRFPVNICAIIGVAESVIGDVLILLNADSKDNTCPNSSGIAYRI